MSQTVTLPDMPVPGTGVVLTNVVVTVEPLVVADQIKFALLDALIKLAPTLSKEPTSEK
jgi:hypothetical protein